MRLRACMGGLLLSLGACAGLPERVRIDVDGHSIEVRQKCGPPEPAAPEQVEDPVSARDDVCLL